MDTMHLFAGVGGGLLADLILGHRPIIAVEWEPYACQVLRERAAEGWFPDLRVWEGDVRLFDPSEYAGKVDCIHAGFPCQDISVAGKQAGVSEGTRSGLYREVLRIADTVRPKYLFLENVAAILSNGLGTVLGDLAAMGYDTRWCCLRASDVGAPHHRDRWWCFASISDRFDIKTDAFSSNTDCLGSHRTEINKQGSSESSNKQICEPGSVCEVLADSNSEQWIASCMGQNAKSNRWDNFGRGSEVVSDAMRQRLQGQREVSIRTPEEFNNSGDACWWNIESNVGRVANGVSNRVQRLKGLGNAQVPLQAAVAWKLLGGE